MKFFRSAGEALKSAGIDAVEGMADVERLYPFYSSEYYFKLINPNNIANDPVAKQLLPDMEELEDETSSTDPLAENEQAATPKLIHRYADRALLLVTGKCAAYCRFCLRKRGWTNGTEHHDISDYELDEALAYLSKHPEIREVLISGGDPLMLREKRLLEIIHAIHEVNSIDIIRIGSRIPVVWPERLTEDLARRLGEIPGLWFATHFNHPNEVTSESENACKRLIRAGVPVVNQSVLLKGVNDNADVLEALYRRLISIRVKPHYLFHVDPVRGVRHFATGIETGLEILRCFRPRLSSLATPTFAIDLPGGGGKVSLQPCYLKDGEFSDIHDERRISYDV